MLIKRSILLFCLFITFLNLIQAQGEKMKGVTIVASPHPLSVDAFEPIQKICANWVVINPFAFSLSENSTKIIYDSPRQWWGERPEGVKDAIIKAKKAGMKVMLKPQIWIQGGWVGNVVFDKEEKWKEWESDYTDLLIEMAKISDETDVDLLCIGTEYDQTVIHNLSYWQGLIVNIRKEYKGNLTYAGNWTHFDQIEIWNDLDFIGINSYFPLSESVTPNVDELKIAWVGKKEQIKAVSVKYDKPVIFTEFGYLSVDGCAYEHWNLEPKRDQLKSNEQGQANAYQALLETFMPESWYSGCFLWKWYPNKKANMGEGSWSKDYTPQGKLAEQVFKQIFSTY